MFSKKVSRIFKVMVAVYAIVVIVTGILGGLCYNKTGWYPMLSDAFPVLFGAETKNMIHLNDSFEYMLSSDVCGLVDVAFIFCTFVLAIIINFTEIPLKAVLAIIDLIGVTAIEIVAMNSHDDRWLGEDPMMFATAALILGLIVCFICFKGTTGSVLMLAGIGGLLFKNILVPLIMWFAFLSTASKIGVLIGAIVFVILMTMKLPAVATGNSGFGSSSNDTSKADKKKQERKNVLENRIAASRKGIKGKQKKSWNYAHVDVDVTRRQIEKDMKELEQLS